jgi:gamma-glutamylcyclotransferase (GGCT)/AIG2-like uncharacterized protein YtfP
MIQTGDARPTSERVIFVYGTLIKGESNHAVLGGSTFLRVARTSPGFLLYDLGRFPGMVACGQLVVVGEIYLVTPEILARVDRLEGHPTFYQRLPIRLDDGSDAESYLLPPRRVVGYPPIASGQWRTKRKAQHDDRYA